MLALIVLILIIVFLFSRFTPSLKNTQGFEEVPLDIAHFGLFDLGVADINRDAALDIFTSNHSGPQSVLINQGRNKFKEQFPSMQLDQDLQFPGLAVLPEETEVKEKGVYISWNGPSIIVRTHKTGAGAIKGKVVVKSPLKIDHNENVKTTIKRETLANGVERTVINFTLKGESYFSFKPYLHALPIRFSFDAGVSADSIYVGTQHKSPSALEFSINMRDRHGMAWADYNGDGQLDLFITRGGQKGWMGRMPEPYWDELFVSEAGVYRDIGEESGLLKKDCSGRKAAWVDYNGDNRLDVYVSCGKSLEYQANKLYEQLPGGHFKEVAQDVGLDMPAEGSFVWLDADNDGDIDLFWVDKRSFYLYENISGAFTPKYLSSNPTGHISKQLVIADFDMDGDMDIFSVSPSGNAFCINMGGDFIVSDPLAWGLPKRSRAANWIDYENDGVQDLHTIPDGLYKQKSPGKFIQSRVLGVTKDRFSSNDLSDAHVSWFDMNSDGARDVLMALNYKGKKKWWAKGLGGLYGMQNRLGGLKDYWQPLLLQNIKQSDNHWLQIELLGSAGNHAGIGAVVTVSSANSDQPQVQQVGASEGSRYSQGHYRLYFGLGKSKDPVTVHVSWPDGYRQVMNGIKLDQLLFVKRGKENAQGG